ncbi:hypothetical protein KY495_13070 [Massilia sp. PAMC28688]|uniref:hypothetical protein n=1 Tax=Massilia sp. PAMC28688 TaxID=2861283 RepID=UPI001C627B25|nr:hypothetical protein [Massilia sp. PAMC28688]QYF91730.1 hypothetical protein KY495_13070 [Massilia sp. PAMC28688]
MQHPSELKVFDIARRYMLLGLQSQQAYQTQQHALELDCVLSQERLQTREGTALSLDILGRLFALTQASKKSFTAVMLASSSELSAATAELPRELRDQYNAKFLESTQWQLDAQSRFYANREHWITAAIDVCTLIESRRATCTFSTEGVHFQDDQDFDLFDILMGRLNDAHAAETEAYAVRMARMRNSLAVLGITTG